jgi:hypothetical protein
MAIRRACGAAAREEAGRPGPTRQWGGHLSPPPPPGDDAAYWKLQHDHFLAELDFEKLAFEREKMHAAAVLEHQKLDQQWSSDSVKTSVEFSKLAINTGLLMNGGAAVAIIAHIASGPARDAGARIAFSALAMPLQFFAGGVAAATACAAAAYLSQSHYTDRRNKAEEAKGDLWKWAAIVAWLATLICFISGATWTASVIAG